MSGGLLGNPDFVRLWAAATISVFGSLLTTTALPFTAILVLDAGASDIALLRTAGILPAVVLALAAGVWVDRLRRRPILVGADLARAALLCTIPIAAWLSALRLEHLYAVALAVGAFSVFFDVAHLSYLPALVERDALLDANGKLSASAHAAEVVSFGSGGFLVQGLGAPAALLVDAASFVASALLIGGIRRVELEAPRRTGHVRREIAEGLAALLRHPLLRPLGLCVLLQQLAFGVVGTVYLLYVTRELGFQPGVLGLIFAVGGVSSVCGALLASRAARRFGTGPAIVVGVGGLGLATLLLPLAPGAALAGAALLVAHQLGDGFHVVAATNEVSLRQALAPGALLGRVNGSLEFAGQSALLLGTLAGGVLGETFGLRATLAIGGLCALAAALPLLLSPVRCLRAPPAVD